MQTAYVVKGHIDAAGTIMLDEPATTAPSAPSSMIESRRSREEK